MINSSTSANTSVQFQVLNEDQIYEIRRAAFEVLSRTGYKVLHEGARKLLKQAGAKVEGEIVKVPEHIVTECLRLAPKGFSIYDRNGQRALECQGRQAHFGTSTASPNTMDALTGEIRQTLVSDIALSARVADSLDNIDWVMPMGSAQDCHPKAADVHEFEAVVNNTTKPMVVIGYTGRGVEAIYEMAAEVAGGLDNLKAAPFLILYPEPITPLVMPADVVDRLFVAAELGLPQLPGPSVIMATTGPATVAGVVTLGTAEAMFCLTLAQLKNPGTPCFLSANLGAGNLRTGLTSGGTNPECSLALAAQADVARSFGLPTWGLAGSTASKVLDAQAGIEAAFHILAQALAGLTLIHDVGYMDQAMVCSTRMLVMGNEIVGMAKRFIRGVEVNRETLARDVIHNVGPGGHFMIQRHTLNNFRDQMWQPDLLTRQGYDSWQADGSKTMDDRVAERTIDIVNNHPAPALDSKIAGRLEEMKLKFDAELSRM